MGAFPSSSNTFNVSKVCLLGPSWQASSVSAGSATTDGVLCFDAGFTPAKVVTEVDVSSKPPNVWAVLQDRFAKLLSAAAQQDPFYAVVAYKEAVLAYKE